MLGLLGCQPPLRSFPDKVPDYSNASLLYLATIDQTSRKLVSTGISNRSWQRSQCLEGNFSEYMLHFSLKPSSNAIRKGKNLEAEFDNYDLVLFAISSL